MLAGDPSVAPVLSLAGRTLRPRPQPIPCRVGGFGGAGGLAAFLREQRVNLLVDGTHPFAARMSANAVAAAAASGVALLRIERPAWNPGPADRWEMVPRMQEAPAALGPAPRRVLLTVGQQELTPFRAAPWHNYLIRSIDPPAPDSLPRGARAIAAAGPFSEAEERSLMAAHRIEVLVTKNSGGTATSAKLAAARALGLPVVMVARPVLPGAETGPDEIAAQRWIAAHQVARRGA